MVKAKVESTSPVAGCLGASTPIQEDDLSQRLAEAVAQQAADRVVGTAPLIVVSIPFAPIE